MHIYSLVSSIFLLAWGLIWSKSDFKNVLCKMVFFGLGVWGLALWLR